MSSRYESKAELAAKVDWEGGVTEAINGYGLGHETLPDDTPIDVFNAWVRIEATAGDVAKIYEWLES
jgi:hypothetical protein